MPSDEEQQAYRAHRRMLSRISIEHYEKELAYLAPVVSRGRAAEAKPEKVKPKPEREGETVETLYHQLKKLRNLYRDNGWSASQLRPRTEPECMILWEWIDRVPEKERRDFVDVKEWEDGDKFIYLQVATLYQYAPTQRGKPSWFTVRDWRKAYRRSRLHQAD